MRTPASIKGHPLHAMLIVFPVGLLIFSLVCDFASIILENRAAWSSVAFYTMVGGFVGALIAAVPGMIDMLSLPKTHVKKIALTHMTLNLIVVGLYAVNIWLRYSRTGDLELPTWLSVAAVAILGVSGWLGAEMVHRHGVGVDIKHALDDEHEVQAIHTRHTGVTRHQH